MKPIIKYESKDGFEFSTPEDCLEHERVVESVAALVARTIGKKPDDVNFSNGGGYLQHTAEQVEAVKQELYELGGFKTGQHISYVGRRLSDTTTGKADLLSGLFTRLYSTDEQHREWGQPYYALNPGKGTNKVWNTVG